jgi:glycerol-3-phosphate cytidylyltransferase
VRVYTGGTYDLFHRGHVNFLRRCAEFGEVTVALNTDEFNFQYKNRRPVMSFEDRKAVLESCKYVSEVVENIDGADSKPTILRVKPDIIVVASDWARKDYYLQMGFTQDWLDEHGISLCYIPYSWGISTTEIIGKIEQK